MLVRIWQFRAQPDKAVEFRAAYGVDGVWASLFQQSAGYLGTELLQSTADSDVYLTVDRWESGEAWAAFLRVHAAQYEALDMQCESLTVSEDEVGVFQEPAQHDG